MDALSPLSSSPGTTQCSAPLQLRRLPRKWSPADDERLRAFVRQYGEARGPRSQWRLIAAQFPGRSAKDCRKRWFHSLHPSLRKGRWTPDEDRVLLAAHSRIGPAWHDIALLIPGRKDDQCAKRYIEILEPSAKTRLRPWSEAEDRILAAGVRALGHRWSAIAANLDNRPPLTCRNRWRRLSNKANSTDDLSLDNGDGDGDGGSDEAPSGNYTAISPGSVSPASPTGPLPSPMATWSESQLPRRLFGLEAGHDSNPSTAPECVPLPRPEDNPFALSVPDYTGEWDLPDMSFSPLAVMAEPVSASHHHHHHNHHHHQSQQHYFDHAPAAPSFDLASWPLDSQTDHGVFRPAAIVAAGHAAHGLQPLAATIVGGDALGTIYPVQPAGADPDVAASHVAAAPGLPVGTGLAREQDAPRQTIVHHHYHHHHYHHYLPEA